MASFKNIIPIWLVPPENLKQKDTVLLQPISGEIKVAVTSRKSPSCCASVDCKRKVGKNFNYFVDKKTNQTIVEVYPMDWKETIDLEKQCHGQTGVATHLLNNVSDVLPTATFGTVEELHFSKRGISDVMSCYRGSTCCIPIVDPTGNRLLLGIAHSKTLLSKDLAYKEKVPKNMYFSAFYAIQPMEPYSVMARSGKFCLGFPTEEEAKMNPYARANLESVQLGNVTFDCPRIHFVSGMVEKADDPSKVIIAYGVNDCVPRMTVIDKADIVRLLFA